MKYTAQQVMDAMESASVIPVFYFDDAATACAVVDAAYQGGLRVFEFTNRGANALDTFLKLVAHVRKYDDALVGAGTIMDKTAADAFIRAGADFIVSPHLGMGVGDVCRSSGVPWIPGCGTLTEIVSAREAGAVLVKLFPAVTLGPAFVRAVRQVIPSLKIMPTGGIRAIEEELDAWFKAGVVCVGLGGELVPPGLVREKNWKALCDHIASVKALSTKLRSSNL